MPRRPTAATLVATALAIGLAACAGCSRSPTSAPDVWPSGTRGDGVADDGPAIQAAINAAGGNVHLPRGVYRITAPLVVDLERVGPTSISGHGTARIVMAGAGPAIRLVGTHRDSAAPRAVADTVWLRQRMPCIDGLEIVGDHPEASGIQADGTMQMTLSRLLIRRCAHGVHFVGSNRNVVIADSHIYDNRGVGIHLDAVNLHQMNVVGCHVSFNRGGGIVCRGGEVRNLQVSGCAIETNHDPAGSPTANVLVDSTDGANAEVAITGCTIQHTRSAPGSANIRIVGPSQPVADTPERRDGHVTISGNVLSDTQVNVHLVHVRGATLTGNTMWSGVEANFLAEHSTAVIIGPNNLDRNPRYSREEAEATDAVILRDCTDCTLSGLQLRGGHRAEAGIMLERCNRINVTGATILDCDTAAILLRDSTRVQVSGCLVRDDRPDAASLSVRVVGGGENRIVGNLLGGPHDIDPGTAVVEGNSPAR